MPSRRRFVALSSAAAVSAGFAAIPASGQGTVIERNARLVVGFPAGSSPDVVARLLAEHMKGYAPSMIVDNRPGAGGRLPLEALKGAERDGSFMVLTPGDQVALFPHVYARLGYDALRDFAPVSTVCKVQFLLTVGALVPADVKTLADFVAWCRANPKSATYGSPGEGTRPHFMAAAFARAAGLEMTHVPYKGGPPLVQDLLSGQIASSVSVVSNLLAHVQAGRLRALATTAPQRLAVLPDVPTAREAGYPALEGIEWFGIFVPRGTPAEVITGLNGALRRSLQSDELRATLTKQSFELGGSSPEELAGLVKSDGEAWAATVKATGFRPMD
jgi:tripartite-type tricarboxylate transporter receptor subunit TctC